MILTSDYLLNNINASIAVSSLATLTLVGLVFWTTIDCSTLSQFTSHKFMFDSSNFESMIQKIK